MAGKTLSVIIPVYNEKETLATLLDRVAAVDLGEVRKEIVIVDDGSTDGSAAIMDGWRDAFGEDGEDRVVIVHKVNGGKGDAVRAGIGVSTGDVVIVQDADLEYDPEDYRQCIAPILEGRAKVVYGSRERFTRNRAHSSWAFYIGGLVVTYWMNLLYGSSMTDEPTCYKTFDGELIRRLLFEGNAFDWEPELTAKLLRLGYEIHEAPIAYHPRRVTEGKKISWKDGLEALRVALVWRFRPLGAVRSRLAGLPDADAQGKARRQYLTAMWSVVLLALLVRLLVAAPGLAGDEQRFWRPDTVTYVQPALALLEDGAYREAPGSEVRATLRPPGFSVLIAAIYGVTGKSWRLLVVALCVIGALTCIPVFRSGVLYGGTWGGTVAGGLFALNMTAISASPLILSDTWYVFFAAWQCFYFLRFVRHERLVDLWLSVGAAAVSALIRPTGLMWLLPCLFLIAVFPRKSWRKRVIGGLVAVGIYVVVLSPWLVRNAVVGAGPVLDSNTGNTLLYHNVPQMLAVSTGESSETIRQRFVAEAEAEFAADPGRYASVRERSAYQVARAKGYIAEDPLLYARLHVQPMVLLPDAPTLLELLGMTQTGRGTLDVLRRQGLMAAVRHYFGDKLWLLLPLLPLLAIVGVTYLGAGVQLLLWRREWYMLFVVLGLVVYYLVLPGPVVMPRYQLPALPLMCVMAAMFLGRLRLAWGRPGSRAVG